METITAHPVYESVCTATTRPGVGVLLQLKVQLQTGDQRALPLCYLSPDATEGLIAMLQESLQRARSLS